MPETAIQVAGTFNVADLSFDDFKKIVINDYRIGYESRQASILGRREVLTGKAKFGIFGDGKEVAQLAMAKAFRNGDWRSGYYRDQTFMFATGMSNLREFFAQLYANPDIEKEPASGGRQMNCHYATRFLDTDGNWINQVETKNCASDISTTAGAIPRLLGLAYASKLYRQNKELSYLDNFSVNGNEVAFGTIGNGSTSEGAFFETFNAAGVLQVPMAISIWDDAYAISVPASLQTTKEDISEILKGFQREEGTNGFEIFKVRGWDYVALCETYERAISLCREEHVPVLIHVTEMTQPQGHSTSGSHERYKSKDRLTWENDHDCLVKMREWMIATAIATPEDLDQMEAEAKKYVRECQREAWNELADIITVELNETAKDLEALADVSAFRDDLMEIAAELHSCVDPGRKDIVSATRKALRLTVNEDSAERRALQAWLKDEISKNDIRYNTKLFSNTIESPLKVPVINAQYEDDAKLVDGREVLNACFDANFDRDKRIVAFGEDLGAIGDVNQGFAGLQNKYGDIRITDTGIRETSIIGQGMGIAMRGLRPIAEIQYLDYLIYAMTIICDDLTSLSYRTMGGQKAPVIIRTRGHRLEGVWHSGSPMGMILSAMRGLHICVPRDMTQAAGMYNTLLRGDEPALVIECLNGYRLKEKLPTNVGEFTVPLGKAEILSEGSDITVVSYGSTLRIVMEAVPELAKMGINIEVIDPQTLYPFDTDNLCGASLKKTNKLLVVDEDVPGAGSAYIMQRILEAQGGYYALDAQPRTLTAKEHRPPYGSDGDYFTKPSLDDVIDTVYNMMSEANPGKFPAIY
ncbi:alpha-ketoacid dehydrogenase subunit alpha/beta [Mucilaginibacter sp. E4BP6]|uniref:alpha-ketoacid dehydrogenase subunit alpha/beta n=1 Tax=Mucilaginibacter sp. E4BP6 TaxID=2723089 RepID=UPI0015C8304A|nr:alpha-ketoacid dehydrogenase subunit alpha/beta [Mucilaginibacter sp. E4BP6]NYE67258.1 pyruvate/2-oxoglutarate/acetoin dehydrogenase E1 component/TPP-dependent pyruvate/acetoin dehydrogenase alpha subunit [Mucilaginibacter sp. E4BP6]